MMNLPAAGLCCAEKHHAGRGTMKIDGGCHCGFIAYEAEVDPEKVAICHCTDCQTLSGSAFRTIAFTEPGTFKVRAGEVKIYVKTAESGNRRQQSFCPECGTPIFSTSPEASPNQVHSLRVGSIRQRDQLVPRRQSWGRSSQTWLREMPSMPRAEKAS
jgi:hypothetical protein